MRRAPSSPRGPCPSHTPSSPLSSQSTSTGCEPHAPLDNVEHVLRRDAGSPSDEHGSGRYGGGYGISLRRRRRRWLDLRPEGYVNVQHKVLLSKNC
uniref:Uncharacterized protein n=1 Tax=Triticum urartu TaxID=4572 RepID=A0A8R7UEV0_TRIUA